MIDPSPKEKTSNEGFLAQKPLGGHVDLSELHNDVAPSVQNLKVVQFFFLQIECAPF